MRTGTVLFLTYTALAWLVVCPLLVLYAYRFYRCQQVRAVKIRRISTTLAVTGFGLLYVIFVSVFFMARASPVFERGFIVDLIGLSMYSVCLHCFNWTHAFRIYMIWFNIRYTKATESGKWKILLTRPIQMSRGIRGNSITKTHSIIRTLTGDRNEWLHSTPSGSASESDKDEDSFWIQYRGSLGSFHRMRRWFSFIAVFIVSISVSLCFVIVKKNNPRSRSNWVLLDGVLLMIPFSLIAVLYYKTPAYRDQFRVKDEATLVIRWGTLLVLLYVITPLVWGAIGSLAWQLVYLGILQMGIPVVTLITTAWVLELSGVVSEQEYRQFRPLIAPFFHYFKRTINAVLRAIPMRSETQSDDSLPSPSGSVNGPQLVPNASESLNPIAQGNLENNDDGMVLSPSKTPNSRDELGLRKQFRRTLSRNNSGLNLLRFKGSNAMDPATIGLPILLSDTRGFDAFMQHLFLEFSSENLLCFVEMFQFHAYCGGTVMIEKFADVQFPRNVPNSAIVFDEDHSLTDKACLLTEKYLLPAAMFQVNLSYKTRTRVTRLYDYDSFESLKKPVIVVSGAKVSVAAAVPLTVEVDGAASTVHTTALTGSPGDCTANLDTPQPNFAQSPESTSEKDGSTGHREIQPASQVITASGSNLSGKTASKSGGLSSLLGSSKSPSLRTFSTAKRHHRKGRMSGTVENLSDIFNEVCTELFKLMKDSFSRFRDTDAYELWFADYKKSGHKRSASSIGEFVTSVAKSLNVVGDGNSDADLKIEQ